MLHLDMGKYAAFVWSAWGITIVVLSSMVWQTLANASRWRAEADRRSKDAGR